MSKETFLLSPASDPFNPFQSVFETPEILSTADNSYTENDLGGFFTAVVATQDGTQPLLSKLPSSERTCVIAGGQDKCQKLFIFPEHDRSSSPTPGRSHSLSSTSSFSSSTSGMSGSSSRHMSDIHPKEGDGTRLWRPSSQASSTHQKRHSSYLPSDFVHQHLQQDGAGIRRRSSYSRRTPMRLSISLAADPATTFQSSATLDNNSNHATSSVNHYHQQSNGSSIITTFNINNGNFNNSNSGGSPMPHFKTEFCAKFRESGHCPFGERCQFVHHESELQRRTRALTYKTKPCWSGQDCPYQQNHARCIYLHGDETAEMFDEQRGIGFARVKKILANKEMRPGRLQQQHTQSQNPSHQQQSQQRQGNAFGGSNSTGLVAPMAAQKRPTASRSYSGELFGWRSWIENHCHDTWFSISPAEPTTTSLLGATSQGRGPPTLLLLEAAIPPQNRVDALCPIESHRTDSLLVCLGQGSTLPSGLDSSSSSSRAPGSLSIVAPEFSSICRSDLLSPGLMPEILVPFNSQSQLDEWEDPCFDDENGEVQPEGPYRRYRSEGPGHVSMMWSFPEPHIEQGEMRHPSSDPSAKSRYTMMDLLFGITTDPMHTDNSAEHTLKSDASTGAFGAKQGHAIHV